MLRLGVSGRIRVVSLGGSVGFGLGFRSRVRAVSLGGGLGL